MYYESKDGFKTTINDFYALPASERFCIYKMALQDILAMVELRHPNQKPLRQLERIAERCRIELEKAQ